MGFQWFGCVEELDQDVGSGCTDVIFVLMLIHTFVVY